MRRASIAALVGAWALLFCGCVGPNGPGTVADDDPRRAGPGELPNTTPLQTQWHGVANLPPPTLEQLEEGLVDGLLLLASTERSTDVLALNSLGNPIGKLEVLGHEARGLGWHSSGFLVLGGTQLLWRIELDGSSAPMGWPRPVSFRPTEGHDGLIWLAEEEDVEDYDPEVLFEGGEGWDETLPEDSEPEGEPPPCFMDVAAVGDGIVALEVIQSEVRAEDGGAVLEGVPDGVESIAFHDGALWLGDPFDETLWRAVDGDVAAFTTMSDLGWPGYGVAGLEPVDDGLVVLATRGGPEDGGDYVVVKLGSGAPQVLSRGGGAWLDVAPVR